jgi:hypothetical protein
LKAMPPRQAQQQPAAARLAPLQYVLHALGAPLLLLMFAVGLAGLFVIMGEQWRIACPSRCSMTRRAGPWSVHMRHPTPAPTANPWLRVERPADTEGTGALAQTEFAKHWKWLINKNAFFQPFMVNFGAIGEQQRPRLRAGHLLHGSARPRRVGAACSGGTAALAWVVRMRAGAPCLVAEV